MINHTSQNQVSLELFEHPFRLDKFPAEKNRKVIPKIFYIRTVLFVFKQLQYLVTNTNS